MPLSTSYTGKKFVPDLWVTATEVIAWIAFGSAQGDSGWDLDFYFGASRWFDCSPPEIVDQLKDLGLNYKDEKRDWFILNLESLSEYPQTFDHEADLSSMMVRGWLGASSALKSIDETLNGIKLRIERGETVSDAEMWAVDNSIRKVEADNLKAQLPGDALWQTARNVASRAKTQ